MSLCSQNVSSTTSITGYYYVPINCMPHPYRTGIGGDNWRFDFPQSLLVPNHRGKANPLVSQTQSCHISNIRNIEREESTEPLYRACAKHIQCKHSVA